MITLKKLGDNVPLDVALIRNKQRDVEDLQWDLENLKRYQRNLQDQIYALEKHNTVIEALLTISILVGTVCIGCVVGFLMRFH